MFDLIIKLGFDIFQIFAQIILSSIIAFFLYYFLKDRQLAPVTLLTDIITMLAASILGILLPFNTFGMLPLFFVFLNLGYKYYQVMPALLSNFIFNMSVPFKDPTFVFRTGYKRVLLAFVIGVIAGFLLRKIRNTEWAFSNKQPEILYKSIGISNILNHINQNINLMGIYMILGVIINRLFNDYVMYTLTTQVASNSVTAFIPRYMSTFNVVSPGFLLALCVIYALLNISNISALLLVLKPKGLMSVVVYYIVWIMILAINMFIR